MSNMIAWIVAEGERLGLEASSGYPRQRKEEISVQGLPAHQFAARPFAPSVGSPKEVAPSAEEEERVAQMVDSCDEIREAYERERRTYRGRTVAMLRRYMRYSMETGRLPSVLGREFFRAKVTSYTVVTFEDRVIFVHDMERCLERLDEFSRQLLARHVLQEHDQVATARLLHCAERTVRRLTPYALDQLSDILLEMGLMERLDACARNSCQGGRERETPVSHCEDSKNKF